MKKIGGFMWPDHDMECAPAILREVEHVQHYLEPCRERRVAVQAGGNVGVWPAAMAKTFREVVTFEPEGANWECLTANVRQDNVRAYWAALGATRGHAGIEKTPGNAGAHQVTRGDAVTVMTVDELKLDDVDLIQLDVEGSEGPALLGAAQTIHRCSPVIVVELKGIGRRYGWPDARVTSLLAGYGYMAAEAVGRDVVFVPTGGR